VFIIIEPVAGAGAGCLLVGVPTARLYQLRRTSMLATHDRVNIYDTRGRIGSTAVTTPSPAAPIAARSGAGLAKRDIKGEKLVPC
jgi:hypothetical protein